MRHSLFQVEKKRGAFLIFSAAYFQPTASIKSTGVPGHMVQAVKERVPVPTIQVLRTYTQWIHILIQTFFKSNPGSLLWSRTLTIFSRKKLIFFKIENCNIFLLHLSSTRTSNPNYDTLVPIIQYGNKIGVYQGRAHTKKKISRIVPV
jgi:hypothetical protein